MPFQGAQNARVNAAIVDPLDELGAIETIDYAHHEIHEGDMFHAAYTADTGNGANCDLVITTNSTSTCHLNGSVGVEVEAHMYFYEGVGITGGNAVTPRNRNRVSANAASASVVSAPTVNSTGTLLTQSHFGSGRAAGGDRRESNEWILKTSTSYLLRITNATTGNNYTTILFDWYEE